jgi:hypothetical protein
LSLSQNERPILNLSITKRLFEAQGVHSSLARGHMEFRESKLEFTVIILAGFLLFGVISIFRYFERPSQIETADVVYEMPRPIKTEITTDFTLGDREIIRQYINQPKPGGQAAINANNPAQPAPQKKAAKKNDKKAAAEAQKKRSRLDINVIDGDDVDRMSDTEVNPPTVGAQVQGASPQQPAEGEGKKPGKNLDEWRALLLSQPTRKNMEDFISAWRAGEINAQGFYQVVNELILTKKRETQNIALMALQAVPHVQTFATIARNFNNFTPENQTLANNILLSYAQPSRLGALSDALELNDLVVVTRAAEVVTIALDRAKSGQGQNPRQARGQTTQVSLEPFAQFVPTFQQWRQSGDATLVNLANSFLSRWQT